jgi:flagellar capping protein FliD
MVSVLPAFRLHDAYAGQWVNARDLLSHRAGFPAFFGDLFDQLLKKLTNSVDGVTTIADRNFQEQIDGLQDRLSRFDARLESRRTRFEAQFAAMEAALAKLQAQQSSLGSLSANVALGAGR